ncbi:hypothetical protein RRF57_009447 [Xylaria bambusicola]|uniref:2EXR domain-containing protein n=1 Tax=Xylaria bambusicola TaxID=326684 RepID=A0AAN7UPZ2_9PEZI
MTSSSPSPPTTTASAASSTANIIDIAGDDSDASSSSNSHTSEPTPQFPRFRYLPAELRHHIWRLAVPSPGINFFNVHCFPNDHANCNRSTSPPWLYLDLRRLDIEDDDDDVFSYDPSSWQARSTIRSVCREARIICAIPESKCANVVLTRPKRGLFVRAGDGQLRGTTPLRVDDNDGSESRVEPVVRRTVQVHVDDILCLAIQNCSFNLPHEEAPFLSEGDGDDALGAAVADEGWAYDPQLEPALPLSIPTTNICVSMARCCPPLLRSIATTLFELVHSHVPDDLMPDRFAGGYLLGHFYLMFDAFYQALGEREVFEVTAEPAVVWDRFGDAYLRILWRAGNPNLPDPPTTYRFVKIWPEKTNIRERYLRSAILRSSKRPARSS